MKPHIVLTRPIVQSRRFGAVLEETVGDRASISLSPLLVIKHLPFGPLPSEHDVIFTSENGVLGFLAGTKVGHRKAFCVGDRTADAAREAGFDARSAGGTAADLIDLIAREGGGEMIYARGTHVSRDLSADLAEIGVPVQEVITYAQEPLDLSDEVKNLLGGAVPLIFPLFSARSMQLLVSQGIGEGLANMSAVCISKSVAEVAPKHVFDELIVCDAPNSQSMSDSLRRLLA